MDRATEEEFEQMLSDMQADEDTEDDGRFRIDNDNLADWAVRKIHEERAENKRLHDIAEEQTARIEEKIAMADRRLESRTAFLMHRLSEYFGKVPHKETKTQSKYQLLSGTLVMTREKVSIEKEDDSVLLNYLKNSGYKEYIKTKEEPVWGEFKKRLIAVDGKVIDFETGDEVSGVKANTKPATFDVK